MTGPAGNTAVILRLIAAGMMVYVLVVMVLQLSSLLTDSGGRANATGDLWIPFALAGVLFLLPGVWLYRNSRELAIRLKRGL